MKDFSVILKELRNKKNISQEELGIIVHVSRSSIAKYENGLGLPSGEDFVNRKFLDEDDLKEVLLAVECGAGNRRSVAMQYKWKSRDRAIMMLFIQTGIRETALSEINIEDIDFENHIIKSIIVVSAYCCCTYSSIFG